MIQLAYQAAYDPFHTAFRMLRVTEFAPKAKLRAAQIKLIDLYIAFPHLVKTVRLPPKYKGKIKKAGLENFLPPYGEMPANSVVFRNMSPIQEAAIHTLVLQGFFDFEKFEEEYVCRTDKVLPDILKSAIESRNNEQSSFMKLVASVLIDLPFEGIGGLKDRTGLLEFRYDLGLDKNV